jgi:D-inositol-3-phosphate glycosyltransferase
VTNRLRVGIVTHYWLPHMGGIEVLARDQAHRLADHGWDVTVFTSRLRGDQAVCSEGAVRIRRFPCVNVLESRFHVPVPLMTPTMLKRLAQAARDLDVLIAHGHVYVGSLYAALASRLVGVPLVIVQHNPFVDYGPILNKIEALADKTLGRAVLESATRVIAVSDFTKRFVESIAPRAEVTRIHPGVDLERFFIAKEIKDGARPLFVTVRRLVPRSGVEVLIRAWVEGGLGGYADLAIAGDGPLKAALLAAARSDPSIRLVGRLSDNELAKLYQRADVFVLPTISGEGYGLALAEALASGVPAIVTDDGAPRELIEHRVDGVVVPAGDASTLAEQMILLASDGGFRATLTKNVLAGRARLDRTRSVAQMEALLRRVISTKSGAQ